MEQLEQEGKAFVIRPPQPVAISRTEKDVEKLNALYQQGVDVTQDRMEALHAFLSQS